MPKTDVDDLTELLSKLVGFKTVTGQFEAATECAHYAEKYLNNRGMQTVLHKSGGFPSLIATTQKTKKPKLLLHAHLDVVPATEPMFNLQEKDGKLIGRGVSDMKFAGAVFLKLVDELKEDIQSYDFGIMFTFDEEIGGQDGVNALLKSGYRADVCILPDAGDNWRLQVTHKGAWIVRISTLGVAAHGSRPWDGDNAIHRLIDALNEISQLFKAQHEGTDTLSVNKISGGQAMNQVADFAEATLDIRFISNDIYDGLSEKIEKIASTYKAQLETIACVKCVKTDPENPYVASFLRVAEKIHGKPIETVKSLGASDARYFDEYDIPTILVKPDCGSHHADKEWLDKDGFEKYYLLIKDYVKQEAKL
jgi:succinyl-diaminopimelate desuccinylase